MQPAEKGPELKEKYSSSAFHVTAVSRNVTPSWPRLNRKDGAMPNMERKVRDRCAESANPAACAASVRLDPRIALSAAARSRRHKIKRRTGSPVASRKRCASRLGER